MLLVVSWLILSVPNGVVNLGIEIPNAIVAQHDAYVRCQDQNYDVNKVHDRATATGEVEHAISQCRAQKAKLMSEAERILSKTPNYLDEAKRRTVLENSFDGYDKMRREMGEAMARAMR